MTNEAEIRELDRNMDAVYDNLAILNMTMDALVASLPPTVAGQFVQKMDDNLDNLDVDHPALGNLARMIFLGWRNIAAKDGVVRRIDVVK